MRDLGLPCSTPGGGEGDWKGFETLAPRLDAQSPLEGKLHVEDASIRQAIERPYRDAERGTVEDIDLYLPPSRPEAKIAASRPSRIEEPTGGAEGRVENSRLAGSVAVVDFEPYVLLRARERYEPECPDPAPSMKDGAGDRSPIASAPVAYPFEKEEVRGADAKLDKIEVHGSRLSFRGRQGYHHGNEE